MKLTGAWDESDLETANSIIADPDAPLDAVFDAAVAAFLMSMELGKGQQARRASARALEVRAHSRHSVGWTAWLLFGPVSWGLFLSGDVDTPVTLIEQQLLEVPNDQVVPRTGLGGAGAWFEMLRGRVAEAAELAERTWRPSDGADVFGFTSSGRVLAIWFHTMVGATRRAEALGELGPAPSSRVADMHLAMWAAARDAIDLAADEPATALEELVPSTPRSAGQVMRLVALWTLFRGNHPVADHLLSDYAGFGVDEPRWLPRELLEEVEARRANDAPTLLRCAIRHGASNRWLWAGYAAEQARETTDEPADRFVATGLLRTAHTRITPRLAEPWRTADVGLLTDRQWEIVDELTAGKSNREIARDLHVAVRTVDKHVDNIFVATGLRSRETIAEAVQSIPT